MLACEALRAPDVHDFEDDPAEPCPGCLHWSLEGGVCSVCSAEFCEGCGKVEVTGQAACCDSCAPVYSVDTLRRPYYLGRSLRRAFEAQSYLHAAGVEGALIMAPKRAGTDHDGLTNREVILLQSWDDDFMSVHTCIAPSKVGSSG